MYPWGVPEAQENSQAASRPTASQAKLSNPTSYDQTQSIYYYNQVATNVFLAVFGPSEYPPEKENGEGFVWSLDTIIIAIPIICVLSDPQTPTSTKRASLTVCEV